MNVQTKDNEITVDGFTLHSGPSIPELCRRWNAFEAGGEVERLRKELSEFVSRWSKGKPPTGAELEIYLDAARAALAAAKGGDA